jgi:hypothetical protein
MLGAFGTLFTPPVAKSIADLEKRTTRSQRKRGTRRNAKD